ncbi:MAG: M15 family metallopeptidase [Xanthomonadales bacterium]
MNNEIRVRLASEADIARYANRISDLLSRLGIPPDYGHIHKLPLQTEAARLKSIGNDVHGREQEMLPEAADAWLAMWKKASDHGIELQPVSAFRSVEYQSGILQKKLDKGLNIKNILEVSAAPGYSEHHSGRAVDITTPGYAALEEEFEHSAAFKWLCEHAPDFGFSLSFARDNRHGVVYEPWHWAWQG